MEKTREVKPGCVCEMGEGISFLRHPQFKRLWLASAVNSRVVDSSENSVDFLYTNGCDAMKIF